MSVISSIFSPSKSTVALSISDIWIDMIALTILCLTATIQVWSYYVLTVYTYTYPLSFCNRDSKLAIKIITIGILLSIK